MATEPATTLLSLPTIVWSGVIAAIISLTGAVTGVLLSNQSGERRLRDQLRHDAAEKQRERLAALRKEVYLKLFEDLTAVGSHLGALAGKDPVAENLGAPLQTAISQLGKVQLVGMQQTALLAGELSSLYGEALFRLILVAKPMHELKIDINLAEKEFQEHMAEAQRANRELRALNESGRPDAARAHALKNSFEHAQQQYQSAIEERSAAWNSFNALQGPFMQAVFAELKHIGPAQAKLMDAMRQEIGLPSDIDFMLERLESDQARMRESAEVLLTELAQD